MSTSITDFSKTLSLLTFLDQIRRGGTDSLTPAGLDAYDKAIAGISVDVSACQDLYDLEPSELGGSSLIQAMAKSTKNNYNDLSPNGESPINAKLGQIHISLARIEKKLQ